MSKTKNDYKNAGYIEISKKENNYKKYINKENQELFSGKNSENARIFIFNPKTKIKKPKTYSYVYEIQEKSTNKYIEDQKQEKIVINKKCIKIEEDNQIYKNEYKNIKIDNMIKEKEKELNGYTIAFYEKNDKKNIRRYITFLKNKNSCLAKIEFY